MKTTTIIFAFVIAFCVGMLALQAALARMESRWPGLVLPLITFLRSVAAGHLFCLPYQAAPKKAAGKDEHSGSELRQHRAIPA